MSIAHLPVVGGPPAVPEALREWRQAGGSDRAFSISQDGAVKLIDFSKPLASRVRTFASVGEALQFIARSNAQRKQDK